MSSGNRTVKYENLQKSLKKHYKPLAEPPERSVLEHLLYACCLEDARVEQADEGFAKLQQTYFDWNEVRVTTAVELAEALRSLPFPMQAASRIKQCLQSIFETRYQYDIDDMRKANLGKATAELEAWKGMSPFVVSYVSQHALGGHSIPASSLICEAMWQCDILTIAELQKNALPGIERAIPKNKGVEFAGLVHQFACDLYHHPRSATPLAVLKEMGASYKSKPKAEEDLTAGKAKGGAKGQQALKSPASKEPESKKGGETPAGKPAAPGTAQTKVAAAPSPAKAKEESKVQKPAEGHKPMGSERPTGKASVAKDQAGKVPASKVQAGKVQPQGKSVPKTASAKGPVSKGREASTADSKSKDTKSAGKSASKPIASKSVGKVQPSKGDKASKLRSDKPKADKAKLDKGKSDKGKAERGKPEKGKSEPSKVDKSKSIKKSSKDHGKVGKGLTKGGHGSVGSNLTKKKPR